MVDGWPGVDTAQEGYCARTRKHDSASLPLLTPHPTLLQSNKKPSKRLPWSFWTNLVQGRAAERRKWGSWRSAIGGVSHGGPLRNSGLARHLKFRHLLQMCFFEMKRATGGASKLVKARQWDEFSLSDQDRSVTINWWSEQGGLVLVDISFISFLLQRKSNSHIIWLHCHCSGICCAQRSEKLQDS